MVKLFDGDSFLADLDGIRVEVRVVGINAPEHDECFGPEAGALLAASLAGTIEVEEVGTDRFGRTLARVYAGGEDVGASQVAKGAALARTDEGDYADDLIAAEEEAARHGRGMWSPTACGASLPVPPVEIAALAPDPPGRDDEHLDDEWVEFTSGVDVDLSGWTVRDESSSNRFLFPPGTVLTAGDPIRLVTGCDPPAGSLGWCADIPVWNNDGDSILLLDERGRVVAHRRYRTTTPGSLS